MPSVMTLDHNSYLSTLPSLFINQHQIILLDNRGGTRGVESESLI